MQEVRKRVKMAVLTRAEKTRQIGLWTDALAKVSLGQEYTIGARRLRRADLALPQ